MKNNKPCAIITGASTGLGQALSIELARKGYFIFLVSSNEKKLKKTEQVIKNDGNHSQLFVVDITDYDSILNFYSKIKNNNVEILVNNAGVMLADNIEDISVDDWDYQININLRGAFLMTKNIIPNMKKNKNGKIVFINSVAGLSPYPHSSAYVASKYGLRGFSASIREELRKYNIKIISIHPGAISTPLWDNIPINFSKNEMMSSVDVAKSIIQAILSPNNLVQEEVIIRRTAGDF